MILSTPTLRLLALGTAAFIGQLTLTGIVAQTASPVSKPSNATGQCKDGTYSTAASKSGACRGHNGVKDWYTATAASPAGTPAKPAAAAFSAPAKTASSAPVQPASQPASQPTPAQANGKASTTTSKGPRANLASTPVAPGGGPGLVWVNTSSNVYHCPGTDFYGKTKAGAYMSESDAKAKGARPDHGNMCSK